MKHSQGHGWAFRVRSRRFGGGLVALMVGCLALAGCGTEPAAQNEPESFADQIASAIDAAEAGGAGDAQLEILRRAQAEGSLSLEDARAAERAMVQCINDAGSEATYSERTDKSGLVVPGYVAVAGTSEQLAITDACASQEAFWVDMVYQTQPTSTALSDAYLDQQAPLVRNCLESHGYTTAPDATTHELLRQALDAALETDWTIDCLTTSGIENGF